MRLPPNPTGKETGPQPCNLTHGSHQVGDDEQSQADFEQESKWQHAGFGISCATSAVLRFK